MTTANPRLFFALWPDDDTRKQLHQIIGRCLVHNARAVQPENLHATLVFLGSQPRDSLDDIKAAAGAVRAEPFTIRLDHLEVWRRSQVLSLCPEQIPAALNDLHDGLKSYLENTGIAVESRPYRPHVTLARKVRHKIQIPDIMPVSWLVDSFSLMESVPVEGGVSYTVLKDWCLNG